MIEELNNFCKFYACIFRRIRFSLVIMPFYQSRREYNKLDVALISRL